MKAVIAGINVEGTPQEILEFQRIVNEKRKREVYFKFMSEFPAQTSCNCASCQLARS